MPDYKSGINLITQIFNNYEEEKSINYIASKYIRELRKRSIQQATYPKRTKHISNPRRYV